MQNKRIAVSLIAVISILIFAGAASATPFNTSVITVNSPTAQTYTGNYVNPLNFKYQEASNTSDAVSLVAYLNGTVIQANSPYSNNTVVNFYETLNNGAYNLTVAATDTTLNKFLATSEINFTVNEYTQQVQANAASVIVIGIIGILCMGIFAYIMQSIGFASETIMKFLLLGVLILVVILIFLILPFI